MTGWIRRKRLDERAFLARYVELRTELARRFPAAVEPEAVELTAFVTSAAIFFSSAAVSEVSANEVGHMVPSSILAASLKPRVAYRVLNFAAAWKKKTTLPSLA